MAITYTVTWHPLSSIIFVNCVDRKISDDIVRYNPAPRQNFPNDVRNKNGLFFNLEK